MFKVGQKVVCVNNYAPIQYEALEITLGKVYTITDISKCVCGLELLHLAGVKNSDKKCPLINGPLISGTFFHAYRFKPLTESWVDELLEKIDSEIEIEKETTNDN